MTKSQKKSAIFAVIGLMLTFFLIITSLFRIAPARADDSGTNVCNKGTIIEGSTSDFDVSTYQHKEIGRLRTGGIKDVDINGKYIYIVPEITTENSFYVDLSLEVYEEGATQSKYENRMFELFFERETTTCCYLGHGCMNETEYISSLNIYYININKESSVSPAILLKIETPDGSPFYMNIFSTADDGVNDLIFYELTTEVDAPGEDLPNDNETNPDDVSPAPDVTEKTWQDNVSEWLENNAGIAVSSSLVTGLAIGIVIYLIIKKK